MNNEMNTNSQLVDMLEKTARTIQSRICNVFGSAERLTIVQMRALDELNRRGHMSMADLAKYLGITPASATSLVERLVLSGWLTREHDPTDRRKVHIVIAENKREEWQNMERKRVERLSSFLQVLSPQQKQDFIRILETLLNQ